MQKGLITQELKGTTPGKILEVGGDGSIIEADKPTGSGTGDTVGGSATNGNILVNGVEVQVYNDSATLKKTATPSAIENFWAGTQAEYDAIATKSPTTIYFII